MFEFEPRMPWYWIRGEVWVAIGYEAEHDKEDGHLFIFRAPLFFKSVCLRCAFVSLLRMHDYVQAWGFESTHVCVWCVCVCMPAFYIACVGTSACASGVYLYRVEGVGCTHSRRADK